MVRVVVALLTAHVFAKFAAAATSVAFAAALARSAAPFRLAPMPIEKVHDLVETEVAFRPEPLGPFLL